MNGSRSIWWIALVLLIHTVDLRPGHAEEADSALSAEEKKDGWILLFDGKSLDGWQTSSGQPSKVPIEDGCIHNHPRSGYIGLQDHGSPCWYKNVKIKPLNRSRGLDQIKDQLWRI